MYKLRYWSELGESIYIYLDVHSLRDIVLFLVDMAFPNQMFIYG